MTLNNFEEQAKERLNNREIQPTNRAWSEISAALEGNKNSSKNNYFWYGIAAGFIGLLIVSVIYFKPKTVLVRDNQIVVRPDDRIKNEQQEVVKAKEILIPEVPIEKEEVLVTGERKVFENEVLPKAEKTPAIASVIPAVERETVPKVIPSHSEEIIDAKLEELLARVNVLERDKNTLTDAEVDSLLRQARNEIFTDRLFREDNAVDASALLSQVEDELDQSFRDQILEKLKTGFNKVRTAVADRNN